MQNDHNEFDFDIVFLDDENENRSTGEAICEDTEESKKTDVKSAPPSGKGRLHRSRKRHYRNNSASASGGKGRKMVSRIFGIILRFGIILLICYVFYLLFMNYDKFSLL